LKIVKHPVFESSPLGSRRESVNDFYHHHKTGLNNNEEELEDDLNFTKNETIDFDGNRLYLVCGQIRQHEDEMEEVRESKSRRKEATEEEPTKQEEDVCVLWNHVPEEIALNRTASSISYKFVMVVDKEAADVRQEMMDGNVKFT
jgi:hypothetical protein